MNRIESIEQLIDIIVEMREIRDGVVETPRQFNFIVDLLNLHRKETITTEQIVDYSVFSLLIFSLLFSLIVVRI